MARSVDEINITNFVDTGQNGQISRYQFTLEVKWTDDQGIEHTHGPQQYTFPNALASMPMRIRRRFAEQMIEATARVALGISSWEDYE